MIFKYQPESRKKDLKNINDLFFMSNEMKLQVESTILKLENIVQNQDQLDQLWVEVKDLLLKSLIHCQTFLNLLTKSKINHLKKVNHFGMTTWPLLGQMFVNQKQIIYLLKPEKM